MSNKWVSRFVQKLETTGMNRRSLLKGGAAIATTALVSKELVSNEKDSPSFSFEKFFQEHYKEMSPAEKERVLQRIAKETKAEYGVDVTVKDVAPLPKVKFAFALSLTNCNGSRLCVEACMRENNQSRDPEIQYIKVLEMEQGSMNLEKGNLYYEGKSVPTPGHYYLPVQCQQCDNPPCTKVCPVEATWKEEDGIVVIDHDWCIGCRYCMAACPYEARHFNFSKPKIDAKEINPNQAYLGNRMRPVGVVEKCTFCIQRTREGKYPACLEACPTGARKFGNILDEKSEINNILKNKRVYILKEEVGTVPSFFYYYD